MTYFSDASFVVPEYGLESPWLRFAPFVSWVLDFSRPEALVELGLRDGVSYFAMLEALRSLEVPVRARGVYDEVTLDPQLISDYHERHFSGYSELVPKSLDFGFGRCEPKSIDILHITDTLQPDEIELAIGIGLSKLSDRAVVLLCSEEATTVPECLEHWKRLTLLPGLAVFWRSPIGELDCLLELSRSGKSGSVRQLYQRLGEYLIRHRAAVNLTLQLEQAEREKESIEASELRKRELILQKLSDQVADIRSDVEQSYQLELSQLRVALKRCKTDLTFYQDGFNSVIGSKSWRVTEPLRAAIRAANVLRGRKPSVERGQN